MRGTHYSFIRLFTILALICLLLISILPQHSALAQTETTATWLLRFEPTASEADRAQTFATLGVTPVRWLAHGTVAQVRSVAPDTVVASSALAGVAGYVEYMEADSVVTGESTPNDPAFSEASKVYGLNMVEAPRAWDIGSGSGDVVLAILDTGLNGAHAEFAERVVPGYDFINEDDDPSDDHGHGTHVAGIAAAAANNEQGGAGICPQCKIMPVKVLDGGNRGTWGTVAAGIYYAVDNGARVINLSLGASATSRTIQDAVDYAEEHDVIVVASSGNAASSLPYYPAAIPWVVAVGATTDVDALWAFSNTGDHIDLTAPGYRIYSTYNDLTVNGGYAYMTGTSMASPYVTGLIGLVAGMDNTLTATEIIDLMTANADDLGDEGKDASFGYGRINAYTTMVAANGGQEPTPPPTPEPPDEPEQPISPIPATGEFLFLPSVARG
ncbi:MAG: S8 family serine peptidase [Caldilinea sp.]|nr:S8 family serine peptidase [Caldilinea sp.]MCB9118184.1 S8 family serine peptidase [Caldilineaceae bacterium]MCB9123352.1 S8 family serine peptidase [Caldilineaceae bacterium]MCO5208347.1 S8 family serine peptidase [Caldilinea sp.]MCW5839887.1 S8 family serine peptidase [Caldilinea sp.]